MRESNRVAAANGGCARAEAARSAQGHASGAASHGQRASLTMAERSAPFKLELSKTCRVAAAADCCKDMAFSSLSFPSHAALWHEVLTWHAIALFLW